MTILSNFYTSNQRSMFDEQIMCINQKKDDHQVNMHIQSILPYVLKNKDKKKRQFDMP